MERMRAGAVTGTLALAVAAGVAGWFSPAPSPPAQAEPPIAVSPEWPQVPAHAGQASETAAPLAPTSGSDRPVPGVSLLVEVVTASTPGAAPLLRATVVNESAEALTLWGDRFGQHLEFRLRTDSGADLRDAEEVGEAPDTVVDPGQRFTAEVDLEGRPLWDAPEELDQASQYLADGLSDPRLASERFAELTVRVPYFSTAGIRYLWAGPLRVALQGDREIARARAFAELHAE